MLIEDIETRLLKPYENNPRVNDEAAEYVAKSIQEFGFKVPLVVTSDYTIVTGHTRAKAAEMLGLQTVPCIIADDLSEEQIQAFRLVDNKASEQAEWNSFRLDVELADLNGIFDLDRFGFELPSLEELNLFGAPDEPERPQETEREEDDIEPETPSEGYYGDARERTADIYNLFEFDEWNADGYYQMPYLHAERYVPSNGFIGFNYMLSSEEKHKGVHFYVDDYQFERIWNNPQKYIEPMSAYDCMLTPDFSLYMNMPMAMKIWNVYRSRMIGQIFQRAGIKVIPTLSWAEEATLDWCFDGIEPGGTVSISTIGVKRDEEAKAIWWAGTDKAIEKLKPTCILLYGGDIGYDFGDIEVVYIENEVTTRWKGRSEWADEEQSL